MARHDYSPFGEEIGSGLGLRSTGQGYTATDTNRWKYGLTESDETTGLGHTWWRKYENLSARWTSPDPLGGSIGDPQSFNRYSYTQNDPVNFVDPSGAIRCWGCYDDDDDAPPDLSSLLELWFHSLGRHVPQPEAGGDNGGGGPQNAAPRPAKPDNAACDKKLAGLFGGAGSVVGSTHDPRSLAANASALSYYARTGLPIPANFGSREPGHGPAPYPQGRGSDKGGIIHIYGNGQGTAANTGLYTPSGGALGRMFTTPSGNTQTNVSYNRGPYSGLTIAFVHVSPGSGGANAMGSVRIGSIGGP
ncbi:MAG TPA: RHS repeat-associated core domain-containing protein [Pyrinomonadaceae bacterium]|nr:RHS repeat-associated core domain-containing protein [Pyrinomonadaceae bacterium]